MKANERSGLLQIDKEQLKKMILEVKAIVSSIINLPAEKKILSNQSSLGTATN